MGPKGCEARGPRGEKGGKATASSLRKEIRRRVERGARKEEGGERAATES